MCDFAEEELKEYLRWREAALARSLERERPARARRSVPQGTTEVAVPVEA